MNMPTPFKIDAYLCDEVPFQICICCEKVIETNTYFHWRKAKLSLCATCIETLHEAAFGKVVKVTEVT